VLISVVIVLTGIRLIFSWLLNRLNEAKSLSSPYTSIPQIQSIVDEEGYEKSQSYTISKLRFANITLLFDALILTLVLFSGVLPWIYARVSDEAEASAVTGGIFLVLSGLLISLPGLPFDWWLTFKIEQKYGFNKSSKILWISDKVKGTLLSVMIGFPLILLILKIVDWAGATWWLWGFGVVVAFQAVMQVLYPRFIMPLFNKFSPLSDGEVKTRLMNLAKKTGFKASTILVMDGSKRSGHSNAFFSGFGRFRRIVLFDTLLEQLNIDQLEGVLAHEIGHYKKGHVPKMLALSLASTFISFWLLDLLLTVDWFFHAFGFDEGQLAPGFLLFALVSGLVTFWMGPVFNLLSRRNEYEADAFAKEKVGSETALVEALRILSEKNLSNLNPHPLYSGFYYSHPTLVERERALGKL